MRRSSRSRFRPRADGGAGVRHGTPSVRRTSVLLLAVILALTALVYWPVRGYDFVSVDDPVYVTQNPFLHSGPTWAGAVSPLTSTYGHFWHPRTLLSLMLDA